MTLTLISEAHDGPVDTVPIGPAQLRDMRAVFATNSAIGVRAISAVDGSEWKTEHGSFDVLRKEYADIEPEPL